MRTRENIGRGMDPEAARSEAERRFGRAADYAAEMRATEQRQARRSRRQRLWYGLAHEFRSAIRVNARRPRFAVAVVATLALGIGASTAVFSFADRLLFTPVAGVGDPDGLATVTFSRDGNRGVSFVVSHVDYLDLREAIAGIGPMVGAYELDAHLLLPGAETPMRVMAELVTANYAGTLELAPLTGLPPVADASTGPRVVMISDGLWRDAFGRSQSVIGTTLTVNGRPFVVTGIAPPGYRGFRDGEVDIWVPVEAHGDLLPTYSADLLTERRTTLYLDLLMRTGRTDASQVESALRAAAARITEENPGSSLDGMIANVTPGIGIAPYTRRELSSMMRVMTGVVAFLLVLACANAANLLLARAAARTDELAIRRAIGAGRGNLVRQLVCEGLVLAGLAGVAGIGLAQLATRALRGRTLQPTLPPLPDIPMDARILGFAMLVSLVTGVLFSAVPALAVTRRSSQALRTGTRASGGGQRMRNALVVAQIAISLALLVAAGLLLGTVRALRDVDLGFDPGGVVEASVDPGTQGYDESGREVFFRDLLAHTRALPGVRAAGLAYFPAHGYARMGSLMRPEGETSDGEHAIRGSANIVTAGFLPALGLELVAGRDFRDDEQFLPRSPSGGVVIINESAATGLFPRGGAVGRHIDIGYGDPRIVEIVGVVRDARLNDAREPAEPLLLQPFQSGSIPSFATLYSRNAGSADAAIAMLRRVVNDLDAALPLYDAQTVSDRVDRRLVAERRLASATALFAFLALALAGIGLYGIMAFAVAVRSREFAVRMALGARSIQVRRTVLRQAAATATLGIAAGLGCAVAGARLVASTLWGVAPFDPLIFAAGAVLLFLTALVASWLPAWRATRIDPATVLRTDSA